MINKGLKLKLNMPEGPECKVIAYSLNEILKNKKVTKFIVGSRSRYGNKFPDNYDNLYKIYL